MVEAQTEIASVHGGFAIRRVSTSPLSRYPDGIIFLMITDKDVEKLKKTFATREDFADLRIEVGDLKDEVNELRVKMYEGFDSLHTKMDRFLGKVEGIELDSQAGAQILYRHSIQIRALADGTGITLPE